MIDLLKDPPPPTRLVPRKRCADCRFVLLFTPPGALKGNFICRRGPPPVIALPVMDGRGSVQVQTQTGDRPVGADYWCHEFAARPVGESGRPVPPDEESANKLS